MTGQQPSTVPSLPRFAFTIEQRDAASSARTGKLVTPHAEVPTPVFMPVGTAGSVKAVTF